MTGELQVWLNDYGLTVVVSGRPVEMETPEVEMGDDTGAGKESWEGLGDEDEGVAEDEDDDGEGEKGVGEENEDEDEGDLVSGTFS